MDNQSNKEYQQEERIGCFVVCQCCINKPKGYWETNVQSSQAGNRYKHGVTRNGIRLTCLHNSNYDFLEIDILGDSEKDFLQVQSPFTKNTLPGPWWPHIRKLIQDLKDEKLALDEKENKKYEEREQQRQLERKNKLDKFTSLWENK